MTIIEKAMQVAAAAHKEQVRKSDGTPYIAHPFMVMMKLERHGFGEEVLAAALLHDTLEDTSVTEEMLRKEFGNEVADIVVAVTENKELKWHDRKKGYIESVRNGGDKVKAVSIADKIHNLESLLEGYEKQGPALWRKFNKEKEDKLWFENEVLNALKEGWEHPLIDEYEILVKRMQSIA